MQILKDGKPYSYAELERKINTGYRSIVANCKELETFVLLKLRSWTNTKQMVSPTFRFLSQPMVEKF